MPGRRPHLDSTTFAALVDAAGAEIAEGIRRSEVVTGHHPTSGAIREDGFRSFLRSLLPQKYFVGTGFAFDAHDQQSLQLDIVVAMDPPFVRVFEKDGLCFLPCEVVLAVIEVKKVLSLDELRRCLKSAASLRALQPFGDQRFTQGRSHGAIASPDEHRCFYSVVALSSDLTQQGWAQKEWARVKQVAEEAAVSTDVVDRVLVLDRGVINTREGRAHEGIDNVKRNIFEWFVHLSNHLDRESGRRPEFDINVYSAGQKWRTLE